MSANTPDRDSNGDDSDSRDAPVPSDIANAVKDAVHHSARNSNGEDVPPANLLTTDEWEHLSQRERRLLKGIFERIARREGLARDPLAEMRESRTFGQRLADQIASFGGSWPFILLFFGFLAAWIALNVSVLDKTTAFDPYPFIFLNLVLSTLAAVQAPVIMMSQNRQTARDRAAAENDYAINLRAEVEIRELHDKLDALREVQWIALIEQQKEQLRLLEKLSAPRE